MTEENPRDIGALPPLQPDAALAADRTRLGPTAPAPEAAQAWLAFIAGMPDAAAAARDDDDIAAVARTAQTMAEEQEIAGAFALAHATLRALLAAFDGRLPARTRGGVLAHLGRTLRQLGLLDAARRVYDDALSVGYDCDAREVVTRALLGLGVLAVIRGNYPEGRDQFERALAQAHGAGDPELIRNAHHGLLNCSMASGDLDGALVNGWNVLRLCIAPDSRAEALLNIGEVCRLTGEHEAALRTFAVAMEWTSQSHVRLHALSGALHCAISGGHADDARAYREALEALLPTIPDAFTRARIGVEFAEALHRLGDTTAAAVRLADAKALARQHGYHGVAHQADEALGTLFSRRSVADDDGAFRRTPKRSEHFRMVLRSLNGLTAATL